MNRNESDPFFSILHTLPEIVYEIDADGHFIYLNDAVENLGYDREELLGKHFTTIVHPDDLPSVQRATVLPRLAGQLMGIEKSPGLFDERRCGERLTRKLRIRFIPKKNSPYQVMDGEVAAIGLYNYDNPENLNFIGTLGIIRDISSKKHSEEAFLRAERHYRVLLENSSDLISIVAHDGTVLFASESYKRILRRDPIDLTGENIYSYIHEEDSPSVREVLENRKKENLTLINFRFLNSTHQYRMLKSSVKKISDSNNDTICYVFNANDITEQCLAEAALRESAKKFRAIAEQSSEVVMLINDLAEIEYAGQSIERIFGYSPFEIAGKNLLEFIHETDRDRLLVQFLDKSVNKKGFSTGEFRFRDKKNSWHIIEMAVNNELNSSHINGIIINLRDMTDYYNTHRALKNSEKKYRSLYDNAIVGIISIHWKGGIILGCNRLGYRLFELSSKYDLIGEIFFDSFVNSKNAEYFIEAIEKDGCINNMEVPLRNSGGNEFWAALAAKLDPEEEIVNLAIMDITKNKETEDQLFRMTFYDSLTGLPNKKLFKSRLNLEMIKSRQFAVMCMGMENLKNINDMYGIETGDRLLREIGSKLDNEYFKKDLVVRFTSDKFLILLSEIGLTEESTSIDNIDTIAQKTRSIFSRPFLIKNLSVDVIPNIGIAVFPHDGTNADDLMHNAESAMYVAKDEGSNSFHYYDAELNRKMMKRLALEKDMKKAIESREFFLNLQPKVDSRGDIVGMEALIRWWHSQQNELISPVEFIPIAEKNKMIVDIGFIALEEACLHNRILQEKGFKPLRIAVNISPYQFSQQDLIPQIIERVKKIGLDFKWLELEITESGILENEKESIKKISELHDMGISISIDDFGTGYSSLSKLKNYPIDMLKIDKSFVEDLFRDERSITLVKTIIDLAHNMGFKVIAEGVETREQYDFLKENHCDYFQGYLFARPLAIDDFINLLNNRKKVSGD